MAGNLLKRRDEMADWSAYSSWSMWRVWLCKGLKVILRKATDGPMIPRGQQSPQAPSEMNVAAFSKHARRSYDSALSGARWNLDPFFRASGTPCLSEDTPQLKPWAIAFRPFRDFGVLQSTHAINLVWGSGRHSIFSNVIAAPANLTAAPSGLTTNGHPSMGLRPSLLTAGPVGLREAISLFNTLQRCVRQAIESMAATR
jgi:hypothetical protein